LVTPYAVALILLVVVAEALLAGLPLVRQRPALIIAFQPASYYVITRRHAYATHIATCHWLSHHGCHHWPRHATLMAAVIIAEMPRAMPLRHYHGHHHNTPSATNWLLHSCQHITLAASIRIRCRQLIHTRAKVIVSPHYADKEEQVYS